MIQKISDRGQFVLKKPLVLTIRYDCKCFQGKYMFVPQVAAIIVCYKCVLKQPKS
jgi:hypothetical protein